MKDIIVQKFGGTSVSTESFRNLCFKKIMNEINKGNKVVVVVSAMGREGDPYATDSLLSLAPTITDREKDLLMNAGETISACVFSDELESFGVTNCVLTGGQAGIETDSNFNEASILKVVPDRILKELETKKVVVVTGFQGRTAEGEITTLGRGGSDTSAVALGVGLDAKRVDIYTDVEGIMTTDPRIVNGAKIIEKASYNEILNLTYSGAKIVHPRAVELAMNHNLKMMVRSTFSEKEGTLIQKGVDKKDSLESKGSLFVGLTNRDNLTRFEIKAGRREQKLILDAMKENRISLDMIRISEYGIDFVVESNHVKYIGEALDELNLKYAYFQDLSKIALVGEKISGVSGVVGGVVDLLYDNDVHIIDTSDSNTTLWFLVYEKELEKAMTALHKKLF